MTEDVPGWPWRPDLCPADLHYTEYLLKRDADSRSPRKPKVIHVGTGLHHHVGLLLGGLGWQVLGMTVSRAEVETFNDALRRPLEYGCFYQDVRDRYYEIDPAWKPVDSMSLFHLGEPPEPAEGMLTEREVIERALTWSREVVFYTGSAAYDRVMPLVVDAAATGAGATLTPYKTLMVLRPHG